MRRSRLAVASVVWLVTAMFAAACANDTGTVDRERTTGTTRALPRPTLEPGTTMAAVQQRGRLIVGTKFDQPGFGQKNPTTGQVSATVTVRGPRGVTATLRMRWNDLARRSRATVSGRTGSGARLAATLPAP
jgi:hypothetical protein